MLWKFLAVVVLAAVLASNEAAVVKPAARASLVWGSATTGDVLLSRSYAYKQAIAGSIQSEDIVFRGNASTYVRAVYATEVGYTQYGTAWLLAGGPGYRDVTLRIQSRAGYGYYYMVDIWGRYY